MLKTILQYMTPVSDTRHRSWTFKSIYLPFLCSLAIGAKHEIKDLVNLEFEVELEVCDTVGLNSCLLC